MDQEPRLAKVVLFFLLHATCLEGLIQLIEVWTSDMLEGGSYDKTRILKAALSALTKMILTMSPMKPYRHARIAHALRKN